MWLSGGFGGGMRLESSPLTDSFNSTINFLRSLNIFTLMLFTFFHSCLTLFISSFKLPTTELSKLKIDFFLKRFFKGFWLLCPIFSLTWSILCVIFASSNWLSLFPSSLWEWISLFLKKYLLYGLKTIISLFLEMFWSFFIPVSWFLHAKDEIEDKSYFEKKITTSNHKKLQTKLTLLTLLPFVRHFEFLL